MVISMGILKIEINVPEAVQAIATFRRERKVAMEQFAVEIKEAVSTAFNQLLAAEMTLFLGQAEQATNKRNGYYERHYSRG